MRITSRFAALAGLLALAGAASAQNLIPNPGFEDVFGSPGDYFPAVWFTDAAGSSSDVYAHTGDWSLRVHPASSLQAGGYLQDIALTGPEGATYELSVHALHPSDDSIAGSGHRVVMQLEFYDADSNVVDSETLIIFDGTTDDLAPAEDVWHRRSVSLVATPEVASAAVSLSILTDDDNRANGLGYFDDVDLRVAAIPGDLNADLVVDSGDLAVLLAAWGPCSGGVCAADLNADGVVSSADLAVLLAAWGN